MYRPSSSFNVPAQLLKGEYKKVNGINSKTYSPSFEFFCSAKSYGGTEREVNGKLIIEDTIQIETWYHPEITSNDAIRLLDDGSEWEIMNNPEDIERRHHYLKFKVRRMVGNA